MEEHHVYHHHHHHYHYHYTYPFPPGLPPNAPQDDEPLNQEAAGHDNEEPSAEDDEEEEEEHSERGDTEDQQNPENRVPNPVQQEQSDTFTMVKRMGAVVFDDCLDILNLDALSLQAQARFTTTNSDDYQEGPPRKKARTSGCPERPGSRKESQHHPTHPQQSDNITVIDKARVIDTERYFRVINCDPAGPQVNICWRVPGQRNIWLLRISMQSLDYTYKGFVPLFEAAAPPDLPYMGFFIKPDCKEIVSMIVSSCGGRGPELLERGEGDILPSECESISVLGRLVGFEVSRD